MNWILEKDIFENLDQLKAKIIAKGLGYSVHGYIPFGGGLQPLDKTHLVDSSVKFAYGSLEFVKSIQKSADHEWITTWCNFEQLRCMYYYPRFGEHLINKDYCAMSYGDLLRQKQWIINYWSQDGCVFIRPDAGTKIFTGYLVDSRVYEKDIEFLGFYNVKPEEICIISSPKNIKTEWRFVIGPNKNVITYCRVKINGELNSSRICPEYVQSYVRRVLDEVDYQPDPFYIMDIAETKNNKIGVLEVNSMSCSGLYGCNLKNIVESIADYFGSRNA